MNFNYKLPIKGLLFLSLLLNYQFVFSQILDGVRIGGGLGVSVYLGSQMDSKISTNTFNKSELNSGFNVQIYKALDNKNELGIRFLKSELWSFKSEDQLGLNNNFNEIAFIYQRSLNNNNGMNRGSFTFNLLAGIGLLDYSAAFYTINPNGEFNYFSSIGNGYKPVQNSNLLIREKKLAVSGILGFNIGCRIAPNLSLFLENSVSLSSSNKFTGNLSLKSNLPNNGFSYHALSLFINLGNQRGRIGCPKF